MLYSDQIFDSPVSNPITTSGDWMAVSPATDTAIRNFIIHTSPYGDDVLLDVNNSKALVLINNRYYAITIDREDNIVINDGLGTVVCSDCEPKGPKTREFPSNTINKTKEEMTPVQEWKLHTYDYMDGYGQDYVSTISDEAKSLLASWIQELGGVPMDMESVSAMIVRGYGDTVLTELNSNPENYYIELESEMNKDPGYKIENSIDCYPGIELYDLSVNQNVLLYYANNPEKNFDTVVDDLEVQVNCEEFGSLCVEANDWTQNIDGKIYLFSPTSEVSADVEVIISGWGYQTSATVETDGETGDCRLVVSEVTYYIPNEEEPEPSRGAVRTVATNRGLAYGEDYSSCDIR